MLFDITLRKVHIVYWTLWQSCFNFYLKQTWSTHFILMFYSFTKLSANLFSTSYNRVYLIWNSENFLSPFYDYFQNELYSIHDVYHSYLVFNTIQKLILFLQILLLLIYFYTYNYITHLIYADFITPFFRLLLIILINDINEFYYSSFLLRIFNNWILDPSIFQQSLSH